MVLKFYSGEELTEVDSRFNHPVSYWKWDDIAWQDENGCRQRIGLVCERIRDDIIAWCSDQNMVEPLLSHHGGGVPYPNGERYHWFIGFKTEDDLVAFKLKWL
jgi:hypothetical protein